MIGIYKITSPTNKVYIGQSVDIEKRFLKYNNLDCKGQTKLYSSLNKHKPENHIFEIIEECEVEILTDREGYWQDFYEVTTKKGLNCRRVTTSDKSGYDSEETKQRRSLTMKGKPRPELIGKLLGFKHSEQAKQNMSDGHADVSGVNNPKAKAVENKITGAVYGTITEASEKENIPFYKLLRCLSGKAVNTTNLKFVDNKFDKQEIFVNIYGGSKIVLDTQTGVFFYSAKEAAEVYNINHSTLKSMLNSNGHVKNKTNLIYA